MLVRVVERTRRAKTLDRWWSPPPPSLRRCRGSLVPRARLCGDTRQPVRRARPLLPGGAALPGGCHRAHHRRLPGDRPGGHRRDGCAPCSAGQGMAALHVLSISSANRLPPPWKRTYPIGLDTEVCTFAALESAWKEAIQPHQREHVMPFFYEQPERFRILLVNHASDSGTFTLDGGYRRRPGSWCARSTTISAGETISPGWRCSSWYSASPTWRRSTPPCSIKITARSTTAAERASYQVPLITIFTAPKPFTDPHIDVIQRNAIQSWLQPGGRRAGDPGRG